MQNSTTESSIQEPDQSSDLKTSSLTTSKGSVHSGMGISSKSKKISKPFKTSKFEKHQLDTQEKIDRAIRYKNFITHEHRI